MKLGVVFLLLGSSFLGLALLVPALGGSLLALLFLWPGAAFLAVAAAYLHLGPRVLGKRLDGSLSLSRVLLLLPYFVLTWSVWRLLRLGPERPHALVAPGLHLGRRAFAHELPDGIRLVVDLTAEFSRSPEPQGRWEYVCLPTLDAFVPELDACVALVERVARNPGPVYIHCAHGHGRSAMIAAAVMVRRGLAKNADEAQRALKQARPGVHLSSSQRGVLEAVCGRFEGAVPGPWE